MAQTYEDRLTLAAFNALGNEPGTCKAVWGSYVGQGGGTSSSPITITFPGRPIYVEIWPAGASKLSFRFCAFYGMSRIDGGEATTNIVYASWGDNFLTFHTTGYEKESERMAAPNTTYHHLALVSA